MSHRKGKVFVSGVFAGEIQQIEDEYIFAYSPEYLSQPSRPAVSLTLPKQNEKYISKTLFPFFDGLIPEGWLLNLTQEKWKIPSHDRMGLLLHACGDCIGAVHVIDATDAGEP
jgi:serine/threonine-protein kinase HipA